MSNRTMLVLLVVLAGVIGLWFYLDNRPTPDSAQVPTPAPTAAFLFAPESGQVTGFTFQGAAGETIRLDRGTGGVWMLETADYKGIADQGASEAAATQVSAMRILSTLPDSPAPESIGLESPAYTLAVVTLTGTQTVEIGALTATGSGYYVRTAAGQVQVVSRNSVDALLNLFVNPPYAETPTPQASPAP